MNAARLARRWAEAGDNRLVMAEALADEMTTDLATKADLAAAVAELRAEIQGLRAEMHGLRAEMYGQRAELVRWMAGFLLVHALGVTGLIVGLVRLFGP
jgi:hypothetical protein